MLKFLPKFEDCLTDASFPEVLANQIYVSPDKERTLKYLYILIHALHLI